jgi:hypothetical protein
VVGSFCCGEVREDSLSDVAGLANIAVVGERGENNVEETV